MIISFSVGNYLSFKEKTTISFIPKSIKDNESNACFTTPYNDLKLLKGGVFIGANASGKSNVLKAIAFMRHFILSSWHNGPTKLIDVESFKLNPQCLNQPSFFEMIFLINDIKYRYGFEVSKSKVEKEWLFYSTKRIEKKYFEREKGLIDAQAFPDVIKYKSRAETKPNALFISTVAQHNGSTSILVSKWFQDLIIISDTDYASFIDSTAIKVENKMFKNYLKKLLNIVDLGFDDFEVITINVDEKIIRALPEEIRKQIRNTQQIQVKTLHKRYDNSGEVIEKVPFDLMREESQGTIKYFALAGPIVECLMEGKILFIDELDSRLHPHLSSAIIKIFNSKKENPNNSQLIFTTQNHNFFEEKILRRDQVYFVDKNIRGETNISNTLINKKIRNDASYKKDYDSGKYGARPNIKSNQLNIFE